MPLFIKLSDDFVPLLYDAQQSTSLAILYRFLQKGRNEYFRSSNIIYMLLTQVICLNYDFLSLVASAITPLPLCAPVCTHMHTWRTPVQLPGTETPLHF